jgi:hypothetical protein
MGGDLRMLVIDWTKTAVVEYSPVKTTECVISSRCDVVEML